MYLGEQSDLFNPTCDPHALECAGEPDVDVELASILMKVQEGPGSAREVAALALSQPGERAQVRQEYFYPIKVFLSGMSHAPSMTQDIPARQGLAAMSSPIARAAVAAGDGAFKT